MNLYVFVCVCAGVNKKNKKWTDFYSRPGVICHTYASHATRDKQLT